MSRARIAPRQDLPELLFFWRRLGLGARLMICIGGLIGIVSLILFVSLTRLQEHQALRQIRIQAEALMAEMLAVREWVSDYGGVWTTSPGSYYLEEKNGMYRKTPAQVTKELSRLLSTRSRYRFHITSTKLKNPENAPDAVELQALRKFTIDNRPIARVEVVDGTRYFRYIIPLYATSSCLDCHADQGYQIGDLRGALSVFVPMEEADMALAANRRALAVAMVTILLLVILGLHVTVNRVVVTPLNQLKSAAVALSQGNYNVRCDIRTGNELETLAQTFNTMVDNLRASREALQRQVHQRTRELNALSQIALTLSQPNLLETALHDALNEVVRATEMSGGAIYLVDTSGDLQMVVNKGLASESFICLDAIVRSERFYDGVLQPHATFFQGDPSRWFAHTDQPSLVGAGSCQTCKTLVAVPLRSRSRVWGALILVHQEEKEIGEEAVQFITCVGNQLGAAVESHHYQTQVEHYAILNERARIAHELHDSLAQTLGWLSLKVDTLVDTLESRDTKAALMEAEDIRRVVRRACYDVRESIDGLRARLERGLIPAMADYVAEFGRRNGMAVDFHATDGVCALSPLAEVEVFRILQEALTNVRKHAHATRVRVDVTIRDGAFMLVVEDNGCGFDPHALPPSHHYGLSIMRERAEHIHGTFYIDSQPGQGTRVVVCVPMTTEEPVLCKEGSL